MRSPFRALASAWQRLRSSSQSKRQKPTRLALETLERRDLNAVDVILEWNDVMLEANARDHSRKAPEQGGPVLTGRAFGIVSAAMYDAYNSINHVGEKFFTLVPNTRGADSDAAVARAAHDTLKSLFPSQALMFRNELKQTMNRIPNGFAEQRGLEIGAAVARRIMVDHASDGFDTIGNPPYVPNHQPGFHDVDPLHPLQGFYGPKAMNIKPMGMDSVNNFRARDLDDGTVAGRAAFLKSAEYTQAFNQLKRYGGDGIATPTIRTEEQTQTGIYWGYDGRPGLGTPPRLYNQIARVIAEKQLNTEAENARLFALLNVAQADAGIASWNTKYGSSFWRPVMGLRAGDNDGNDATDGDAGWSPLGAPASNPRTGESNFTPPFPAYTSGHATFGAAAFETIRLFYGRDNLKFTFVSDELNGVTKDADGTVRPRIERTYTSLNQAKQENAMSRIFLGIHWLFDAKEGIRQGNTIARHIFKHTMGLDRQAAVKGAKLAVASSATNAALLGSMSSGDDNNSSSQPTAPAIMPGQMMIYAPDDYFATDFNDTDSSDDLM